MFFSKFSTDGKICSLLVKKFFKSNDELKVCDFSDINDKVNDYLDHIEQYDNYEKNLFILDIHVSLETAKRIEKMKNRFKNLLLIDHIPNNHYYLKKFDWTKLSNNKVSSSKILFSYLDEKNLIDDYSYEHIVDVVDENEKLNWLDNQSEEIKFLNDLNVTLPSKEFINRLMMNSSLKPSKKEKSLIELRNKEIENSIKSINPVIKGKTCYIFAFKYINEISKHFFNSNSNIEMVIAVNPMNQTVSYRSKNSKNDASEVAKMYNGNGNSLIAGSKIENNIMESLFETIMGVHNLKDYTN
ncbi:hypothetical protein Bp8pS_222 [Bacillus phage vB_BpuM-BpSp]|nr:hypothetical protein Bp8pS_222 [Bacillus phage vB_BpuM-BpSp]